MAAVNELGLTLAYTLDTHIHADHITAALQLKQEVGSRIANAALDGLACTDFAVEEGRPLEVGRLRFMPLHTPGHTDAHFAFCIDDRVLTGDALLIDGCGRTDFQNGDATALYRSVHDKLFSLPDDTLVYPAHDYKGRRVSTIAQEKQRNPRLGNERPLSEFARDHGQPEPALSEVHRLRRTGQSAVRRLPRGSARSTAGVLQSDDGKPARLRTGSPETLPPLVAGLAEGRCPRHGRCARRET